MSSFASLMKKAAAASEKSSREAAEINAQREEAQRKARLEQEQREAKEREQRRLMVLREVEARRKAEREEQQKQDEATQKEKERTLKPAMLPSAAMARVVAANGKSRSSSPKTTHNSPSSSHTLTREEKRALADPLLRETVLKSRASGSGSKKYGVRLPGGAINRKSTPSSPQPSGTSARTRIAADFQTLTPLNTVKKDLRSIDEITRDLEKGRFGASTEKMELVGPDATHFTDWFSKSKREREKEAMEQRQREEEEKAESSRKATQAPPRPEPKKSAPPSSKPFSAKPTAPSPLSKPSPVTSSRPPAKSQSATVPASKSLPASSSPKSKAYSMNAVNASRYGMPVTGSRPQESQVNKPGIAKSVSPKRSRHASPSDSEDSESDPDRSRPSHGAKRKKPRRAAADDGYVVGSIAALFGRDLRRDAAKDFESEDEDDGYDAPRDYAAIEREERRSAKLAKLEDARAEEEERLHEAEKKRKKLQKFKEQQRVKD